MVTAPPLATAPQNTPTLGEFFGKQLLFRCMIQHMHPEANPEALIVMLIWGNQSKGFCIGRVAKTAHGIDLAALVMGQ